MDRISLGKFSLKFAFLFLFFIGQLAAQHIEDHNYMSKNGVDQKYKQAQMYYVVGDTLFYGNPARYFAVIGPNSLYQFAEDTKLYNIKNTGSAGYKIHPQTLAKNKIDNNSCDWKIYTHDRYDVVFDAAKLEDGGFIFSINRDSFIPAFDSLPQNKAQVYDWFLICINELKQKRNDQASLANLLRSQKGNLKSNFGSQNDYFQERRNNNFTVQELEHEVSLIEKTIIKIQQYVDHY